MSQDTINSLLSTYVHVDKELSDLSFSRVECPRCGAIWMNGHHCWNTGQKGDEETLSNLVCGIKDDRRCINPKHKTGHIYGEKDTWQKRASFIDQWSKKENAKRKTD